MYKKFEFHGRRSIRLKGLDYSSPNYYFVTFCVQNRECVFGEIVNREMVLNKAGEMVEEEWQKLPSRFDFLELDEYIIMPNHIHALLQIICRGEPCVRPKPCIRPEPCIRPGYYILPKPAIHSEVKGDHKDRPYGTISRSIGRIIQAYKSITTHQYIQQMNIFQWPEFQKRLWQRNYYENIIHNENELQQTREYIRGNPANWFLDEENPQR